MSSLGFWCLDTAGGVSVSGWLLLFFCTVHPTSGAGVIDESFEFRVMHGFQVDTPKWEGDYLLSFLPPSKVVSNSFLY